VEYLIFCANAPLPTKYGSMGAAINAACTLIRSGTAVRRIKGTDGFVMERSDIEIECLRRIENEHQGKP
jgi:hypothetical protein